MPADPRSLDDDALDALIDGRDVPAWAGHLSSFVAGCRAAGDGDPPPPSPALAHLLRGDDITDTRPLPTVIGAHRSRRAPAVLARVAGVGLAVKIGLGAGAAAAGVLGAGALHVLPGAPGEAVRDAIEATTPFELDDPAPPTKGGPSDVAPAGPETTPAPDGTAGEHGDAVSDDATGESDGVPGVDGPSIAESAPGADRRPEDASPGSSPGAGDPPATGVAPGGQQPGDDAPETPSATAGDDRPDEASPPDGSPAAPGATVRP